MMHELFQGMHPNAKARNGLLSRIGGALARPWQTSYVCPSLMTATAVAYALRGYEPEWSPVRPPDDRGRSPSSVHYRVYKTSLVEAGERYPSHGVELRAIFPRWMVLAECELRNRAMRWSARRCLAKATGEK